MWKTSPRKEPNNVIRAPMMIHRNDIGNHKQSKISLYRCVVSDNPHVYLTFTATEQAIFEDKARFIFKCHMEQTRWDIATWRPSHWRYFGNSKFDKKIALLSFKMWSTDHNEISLWSADYIMKISTVNFQWISNSIEISFVGRVSGHRVIKQ